MCSKYIKIQSLRAQLVSSTEVPGYKYYPTPSSQRHAFPPSNLQRNHNTKHASPKRSSSTQRLRRCRSIRRLRRRGRPRHGAREAILARDTQLGGQHAAVEGLEVLGKAVEEVGGGGFVRGDDGREGGFPFR